MGIKSLTPALQDLRSVLVEEIKAMDNVNYDQCTKLLDDLLEKVDEKLREGGSFGDIRSIVVDFISRKEREASEEV